MRRTAKCIASALIATCDPCRQLAWTFAGWRVVPVPIPRSLRRSRASLPCRASNRYSSMHPQGMPRTVVQPAVVPRAAAGGERAWLTGPEAYIASLSSATISYKGMIMPDNAAGVLSGLEGRPALSHSVCVFHQRFSTNTLAAVAARAAIPLPCPQWRDQHDRRQPQLGAGARRRTFAPTSSTNISDLDPLISLTGLRLVESRQHARGIARRRHGRAAGACAS